MKLVLAEKPSVAQSIAKVLGATKREDGYLEGNGYVVSWCVGHLVELSQPEAYDVKAKLFCPEIAGLFCRIAGLFCHDSRANLSLKPVCFGIAIS